MKFPTLRALKIIIGKLKKIPAVLASHAFSIILLFTLINAITATVLWYVYVVLVQANTPQIMDKMFKFKYDTYQQVVQSWQAQETLLRESADKKFTNPFTP